MRNIIASNISFGMSCTDMMTLIVKVGWPLMNVRGNNVDDDHKNVSRAKLSHVITDILANPNGGRSSERHTLSTFARANHNCPTRQTSGYFITAGL
jgi:hypothetical protein